MQQIRIIGSTATGWHRVDELTAEALLRFASVEDVHYFWITACGVTEAPSTVYGFVDCEECPLTKRDAHKVLEMIRPMLLEAEANGQANRF